MKITAKYNAHPIYVELARMFSSVSVMGPPMSEKLVAIVSHLFSLEEARLCRHLSFMYPKGAAQIARKSGIHPDALISLLDGMVRKRTIITIAGRFMLYPLIPGTFEHILRNGERDEWHAGYAEQINELVDSGYLRDYFSRPINAIRNIPVHREAGAGSVVVDSDLVSEMIDAHRHFAVFHTCPCRHSMRLTGHDCRRASADEGCLTFGDYSLGIAAEGNGRTVSKEEMLDIVAERRAKDLVFFTSNVLPSSPTAICTCCDCCCRALKIHNSFSKNLVAPPRAIAVVERALCNNCGRCVSACNTYAHTIENGEHRYDSALCIGCGNCVDLCKKKAVSMTENTAYRPPSRSYARLVMNMLPPVVLTGFSLKLKRYLSKS
jgi:ferredoxin